MTASRLQRQGEGQGWRGEWAGVDSRLAGGGQLVAGQGLLLLLLKEETAARVVPAHRGSRQGGRGQQAGDLVNSPHHFSAQYFCTF